MTSENPASTPQERLRAQLEKCGHTVTAQRRIIYHELVQHNNHPTAEELYRSVRMEAPELSLATVYKNLHLFHEVGLVRTVTCPDGTSRFEANVTHHHHLRCVECGTLVDVEDTRLDIMIPPGIAKRTGFVVLDYEIQLTGLCSHCQHEGHEKRHKSSRSPAGG